MGEINTFLAATDFSQGADDGVRRAAMLAVERAGRVDLLHVVNGSSLRTLGGLLGMPADIQDRLTVEARTTLDDLAADVFRQTGIEPSHEVRVGNPVDEILETAAKADVLVVGAHGSSGLSDHILGTTAERLVRKCPQPVLITNEAPSGPYVHVLVPVALGPRPTTLLRLAMLIAPNADITVFHAASVPYETRLRFAGVATDEIEKFRADTRFQALAEIDNLIESTGDTRRLFRRSVEHGGTAQLIMRKAEELQVDLIVMGKQGQSPLEKMLVGGVTRHILAGAACDILVVGSHLADDRA